MTSKSANRLVALAALMLPAGERHRFGEEFRSELWELTSTGASRRVQLAYAIRLLAHALSLRAAVLAAPRAQVTTALAGPHVKVATVLASARENGILAWVRPAIAVAGAVVIVVAGVFALGQFQRELVGGVHAPPSKVGTSPARTGRPG